MAPQKAEPRNSAVFCCSLLEWDVLTLCVFHSEGNGRKWLPRIFEPHVLIVYVDFVEDLVFRVFSFVFAYGARNGLTNVFDIVIRAACSYYIAFFLILC